MRCMRRLALGCAVLAACGDSSGPGNAIPAELEGRWVAETSCLYQCGVSIRNVVNPAESLNVTAFYNVRTELTLSRRGTYRLVPGFTPTVVQGQVEAANGVMVARSTGGAVDTADYQVTGNRLQVDFRQQTTNFGDINGDGVPDAVRLRGVFQRQ